MAFGFPAFHETVLVMDADSAGRRQAVARAVHQLGWTLREETDDTLLARVRWGTASSGEWVKVSGLVAGTVLIRSESFYRTQCIDWGRNKANVERLVAELRHLTH